MRYILFILIGAMPIMLKAQGLDISANRLDFEFGIGVNYNTDSYALSLSNTKTLNNMYGQFKVGSIRYQSFRHYFENSDSLIMLIDEGGRMTRPKTNNSDLLPIAYGSVCKEAFSGDPLSVYDDTGNFTITEGAGYIDITFHENIAGDVVLSVSPVSCAIGGVSATQSLQTVMNATTIRVSMYMPDGSVAGDDKGFSFVAYKK